MAFVEGQQVLVKHGQNTGTIARKLSYIDDMYVVLLHGDHKPSKKLAHEADLELLTVPNERRSA